MSIEPSTPLHQPRLAELIADKLRRRILTGQLSDGEVLPNQDSLLAEFQISKPSLREAMRILEAEGLITIRRGNVGGAFVHRPQARHAAYTLSLVLQAEQATVHDVGGALKELEGTCAELCARRDDRATEVVPHLRDANARARETLDDMLVYVDAMADFHRALVARCGNTTMQLISGSVEALWLAHVQDWATSSTRAGTFPDRDYRLRGLEEHERLTELIADGAAAEAGRVAHAHFDPDQFYAAPEDARRRIDASMLKTPGRAMASGRERGGV
jgi:GntR family transcriptional repressor for pyruvate dehydrogenase complex